MGTDQFHLPRRRIRIEVKKKANKNRSSEGLTPTFPAFGLITGSDELPVSGNISGPVYTMGVGSMQLKGKGGGQPDSLLKKGPLDKGLRRVANANDIAKQAPIQHDPDHQVHKRPGSC